MRALATGLLVCLTLTAPVRAQDSAPVQTAPAEAPATETPPADDPIGALLADLPPDQTTDMEDEASVPQAIPAEPTPAIPVPIAPMAVPPPKQDSTPAPSAQPSTPAPLPYMPPPAYTPPRPQRPTLDRPVMIGETGRSPDAPPNEIERGYELRLRSSSQSAQGLQGPLDGGWTVRGRDGAAIVGLQVVDRGSYGPLEGAWRLMNGSGRVGLIDSLDRQGTILTVRISRGFGKPVLVLTLAPGSDGSWSGDITDEAGTRPVTMRRN